VEVRLRDPVLGSWVQSPARENIGRTQVGISGWNVRFRLDRPPKVPWSSERLIVRPAEVRKGGRALMRVRAAADRCIRSWRQLSQIHVLLGSHIAGDDALRHRFGAGPFITIHIGLVLVRIGLGERRPQGLPCIAHADLVTVDNPGRMGYSRISSAAKAMRTGTRGVDSSLQIELRMIRQNLNAAPHE